VLEKAKSLLDGGIHGTYLPKDVTESERESEK
jgi:hypothetical protein